MLFVRGLKPEVKTSVSVNVPEGAEDAITWAYCVDLWQSREGAGQEVAKSGKRKQKKEVGLYWRGIWSVCWWPNCGSTGSRITKHWWPTRERREQRKAKRQVAATIVRPEATQVSYLW